MAPDLRRQARDSAVRAALGRHRVSPGDEPGVRAAIYLLADLATDGWGLYLADGSVEARPPSVHPDPHVEKQRVRNQEQVKRAERLSESSVTRFVAEMETRRLHGTEFVSVFSLMRDGEDLAAKLRKSSLDTGSPSLAEIIDPYLQLVQEGQRCDHTGLRLTDIWRYFRLTWSNQHTSLPGRRMQILVRDRAADRHPVIGIIGLSSAVMQLSARDAWIGWDTRGLLEEMRTKASPQYCRWLYSIIDHGLEEIYTDDLFEAGVVSPRAISDPDQSDIDALRAESLESKADHYRFVDRADFKRLAPLDPGGSSDHWLARARTDLFISKRASALADLLESELTLRSFFSRTGSKTGLRAALGSVQGRSAITRLVRRQRAERAGTLIADLTVCGSVAPYNHLLGGKLVSLLAVSPEVVGYYRERYGRIPSEIASSLAGRPIVRPADLAFIGTTSLYGSGSSQYNRLRIPGEGSGGSGGEIRYERLGFTESYGTAHLSEDTVKALVDLVQQSANGRRVNSIFGEGVSPKMRKIRQGIDLLGWPSDALLRHGRRRIIYGVSLVGNLKPYLLGLEGKPDYILRDSPGSTERIAQFWRGRWLERRLSSEGVLDRVASERLAYPITHGARVALPASSDDRRLF